jgi:hypothetical protein
MLVARRLLPEPCTSRSPSRWRRLILAIAAPAKPLMNRRPPLCGTPSCFPRCQVKLNLARYSGAGGSSDGKPLVSLSKLCPPELSGRWGVVQHMIKVNEHVVVEGLCWPITDHGSIHVPKW